MKSKGKRLCFCWVGIRVFLPADCPVVTGSGYSVLLGGRPKLIGSVRFQSHVIKSIDRPPATANTTEQRKSEYILHDF